jgi:hypothetical protein
MHGQLPVRPASPRRLRSGRSRQSLRVTRILRLPVSLFFDVLGMSGARLSFRSCERSEMHPPSKRKAQLAVERDSRMVRTEDMQERHFAPHCYR